MTCKEIVANLPAFQEEELTPTTAGAVRQHLGTCTSCAQELVLLEKTWAALDAWEAIEPAPSFNHRFWKAVEKEPVGTWQKILAGSRAMLTPVRAFAVVLVVVLTMMVSTVNVPPGPETSTAPTAPAPTQVTAVAPPTTEVDVAEILQTTNLGRPPEVMGNPTDVLQVQSEAEVTGLPKLPMERIRVLDQDSTSSQKMLDHALQLVDDES